MDDVTLTWQKAGTFSEICCNRIADASFLAEFTQPGVYLWVETSERGKLSNYVGKATLSVMQRNFEHYANFLQLYYSIPARYNSGLRYVVEDEDRFPISKRYDAVKMPRLMSLQQREERMNALQRYLCKLEIYYAVVPQTQYINQIEKQLISDCLPVENCSATLQQYALFNLHHTGTLSDQDIALFRQNAITELNEDRTRPTKARYRSDLTKFDLCN